MIVVRCTCSVREGLQGGLGFRNCSRELFSMYFGWVIMNFSMNLSNSVIKVIIYRRVSGGSGSERCFHSLSLNVVVCDNND